MKVQSHQWHIPLFMAQMPQKTLARMGIDFAGWQRMLEPYLADPEPHLLESFVEFENFREVTRSVLEAWGSEDFINWYLDDLCPYHLGPVGIAVTSAPTLGDSIDMVSRFAPIIAPAIEVTQKRSSRDLTIRFRLVEDLGELQDFYVEMIVLQMKKMLETVSANRVNAQVSLNRLPQFTSDRHWRLLAMERGCNYLAAQIQVEREALAIENQAFAPHVYQHAIRECRILLENAGRFVSLRHRVRRQLLDGYLKQQDLSVDAVAAALRINRRTLARRLQEEGSRFRDIQLEARMELAVLLLKRADHSIKQVCAKSGFTNHSAFSRAFRNYTTLSPSEYRQQILFAKFEEK